MSFPAKEEHSKNWGEFLGLLTELDGEWLFRGAMSTWSAVPSLERASTQWGVPPTQMPDFERKLLREFKRHPEVKGLVGDPSDDLEWFSIMQHYGAPRRLLDWGYSPFAALFFALDSLLNSNREDDAKGAVWAIRAAWFDEVTQESRLRNK